MKRLNITTQIIGPLGLSALLLAGHFAVAAPANTAVTFKSLVAEMLDFERLVRMPEPPYTSIQFSSYERNSVAPGRPDWFANSDGFGNEPVPGFLETLTPPGTNGIGRYLVAKVDGPGAIVRTWTPHGGEMPGRLLVYLDNSKEPIFDGPADLFLHKRYSHMTKTAGENDPFVQWDANYMPVPFGKGLRIEYEGSISLIHFYHVQVRRYAPGTAVKSFTLSDLEEAKDGIAVVGSALQQPDSYRTNSLNGGEEQKFRAEILPNSERELLKVSKQGAVHELRIKMEGADGAEEAGETLLQIFFDGSHIPQVEAPIDAFFANRPGPAPFASLPIAVDPDGNMRCRFVMPFERSMRIVARNYGNRSARLSGSAFVNQTKFEPGRTMHFYARWQADHGLVAGGGHRAQDIPMLNARGRGQLVGTSIMLFNPTDVVSMGGSWWGEGDEKIYVDGESFPCFFGTGSEDYFNYSWGVNTIRCTGISGQPLSTGPGGGGFVVNYRWHLPDPIPFQSSIDFYIELWHHSVTPGFSYTRTLYYYAFPETKEAFLGPVPDELTRKLSFQKGWQPRVQQAKAESSIIFQAEDLLQGRGEAVSLDSAAMYSGNGVLAWRPGSAKDTLSFEISLPQDGDYEVFLGLALGPKAGSVAVSLDSQEPFPFVANLQTPHLNLTRVLSFGRTNLKAGKHIITLLNKGEGIIGTDFIWLLRREK